MNSLVDEFAATPQNDGQEILAIHLFLEFFSLTKCAHQSHALCRGRALDSREQARKPGGRQNESEARREFLSFFTQRLRLCVSGGVGQVPKHEIRESRVSRN